MNVQLAFSCALALLSSSLLAGTTTERGKGEDASCVDDEISPDNGEEDVTVEATIEIAETIYASEIVQNKKYTFVYAVK